MRAAGVTRQGPAVVVVVVAGGGLSLPESAGRTPVEKRMIRMRARMMDNASTIKQIVILMFFQKYLR